jgi:hypothetical protein
LTIAYQERRGREKPMNQTGEAQLRNIPTNELLEELSNREGVTATTVAPYQDKTVTVSGPAVVVVIID